MIARLVKCPRIERPLAESRAEAAVISVVTMVAAEAQRELKSAAADPPDHRIVTAVVMSVVQVVVPAVVGECTGVDGRVIGIAVVVGEHARVVIAV